MLERDYDRRVCRPLRGAPRHRLGSLRYRPGWYDRALLPVDGGEPSRFLTNMVTGDEVRLRKGIYNVVVFNQAAEEYSYLTIEGQDQYSTLRIVMKTTESDWYTPTEGERLIYDPEPLAVATLEGFEVTQEMVRRTLRRERSFPWLAGPRR